MASLFFVFLLFTTTMAQTFTGNGLATQNTACMDPTGSDLFFNFPFTDEPNPTNCIPRDASNSSPQDRSIILTFNDDNTVSAQFFSGPGLDCTGTPVALSGNPFQNGVCEAAGNAAPLANSFFALVSWTEMMISE